ncbi:MFS transporter [Ekhidna sp.]|uniref:MFS transporter n=1 Tax=Ekhidna sp. TaxID=2608089 RepID=UPI003B505D26
MSAQAQHQYPLNCPTGRWTMFSTILATSMAFIDGSALNVILPSLQQDLSADGVDLFWVLNSYLLMLAALIIVGGSLGDKLGRVNVFKAGILIFTVGSALCGLSQDIKQLIIFRTIQGIGGAFMIPGSLSIISAVFSKEEKGKAIGTWSAATTIVTICGPVLGGALADMGLWRLIFFINLPLGLLSILALHFKVPESKEPGSNSIDWKGAITLTVSLAALTFGFLEMPEWGFDHPVVIASLAIGTIFLVAFVIIESRVNQPMVPLKMFKNKTFSGVNLLSFFLYAGMGAVMLFLSLNIIQIQGYSQLQAGLTFLPFSLIMVLAARKMGELTSKYGARRFLILGPTITGIGMVWFSFIEMTTGPSEYWTTYFPPFLVFALGIAITVVPLTTAVMECVDDSKSGIASGINNSVTRISGTFMNAILGAVVVLIFGNYVIEAMEGIALSEPLRNQVMQEASKLGEASAPGILSNEIKEQVNTIFDQGFISIYKMVCWISAGLAFMSAAIAYVMVESKKV